MLGPFGVVVGVWIYSIAGVDRHESCVWVSVLLLVLLTMAYFFFMATEAAFVDKSLCISEIVEVHSDVLVDLLVVLAKVFNVVAPRSPWMGYLSLRCWSVKRLGRRSDLGVADR